MGTHSTLGGLACAILILTACGGGGGGAVITNDGLALVRDTFYSVGSGLECDEAGLFRVQSVKPVRVKNQQCMSAGLVDAFARSAHVAGHKGQGVKVAVMDDGVDSSHPDSRENILREQGRVVGLNTLGPKFGSKNESSPDTQRGEAGISHGTHVAGIIAARDNNFGVLGVAPEAKIIPIKVFSSGNPERAEFGPDVDPDDPSFAPFISRIAEAAAFVSEKGGFVANGSFGFAWRPTPVAINRHQKPPEFVLKPRWVNQGYAAFTAKIFTGEVKRKFTQALANNNLVFVFAAGNSHWNGKTGELPIFDRKLTGEDIHQYLNEDELKPKGFLKASSKTIAKLGIPANLPSPISAAFLGNPEFKGQWLSVVSATLPPTGNTPLIANYSNGCGEARFYCLSAPGSEIVSTTDPRDTKANFTNKAGEKVTGYAKFSGTSMAAPVVSGALAVIKSQHPRITAKDAVRIVLCTATDLDGTPNRPSKSIAECVTKGPEATHANGWTPSEVFGHGLVNLKEAIKPRGIPAAAGGDARSIGALARIPAWLFPRPLAARRPSAPLPLARLIHSTDPIALLRRCKPKCSLRPAWMT